jgi:hypothetical protein
LSFIGGVIGCLVVVVLLVGGGRLEAGDGFGCKCDRDCGLILCDERFDFWILKFGREGKRERDEKRKC